MSCSCNGACGGNCKPTLQVVRNSVPLIKYLLDQLADQDRLTMFRQYCTGCGSKDPNCKCWDTSLDE
jgi:hypothetical protein